MRQTRATLAAISFTAFAFAATVSPGARAAVAPSGPDFTVHVKDFKFAPTPLRVHVGNTVRFINDDDEAHTVTANDKSFDSQGLDTSGTWDHTFTRPGTFAYFCELHPYMKAVVIVTTVVNE